MFMSASINCLNVLQNASSNSLLFSSSFICAAVSSVTFSENSGNIAIIYATEPLLYNVTKIICLSWLTFDIFN